MSKTNKQTNKQIVCTYPHPHLKLIYHPNVNLVVHVLLTIQWSILWSPSCQTWTQSCDYCYSYEIEIFTFIYSTSKATNEWVIDCQQPGSLPSSLLATPLDSTVWKCTCYYDISGVSIIFKNWVFFKGWYERLEFFIRRWSVVFYKRGVLQDIYPATSPIVYSFNSVQIVNKIVYTMNISE